MSNTPEKKIRIGITGQTGFIGTHLYNYLGLQREVERIPFRDEYFSDQNLLIDFVGQCDVLVHLAAVNRHADSQILHDTNVKLVQQLIAALDAVPNKPHILFSSSTQEKRDNRYGQSKRVGRELLAEWAEKNHALFTGMVIPNVFGPFGRPFYNSVISTFSHQLIHQQEPKIEIDAELPLIYVNDLVAEIWQIICDRKRALEYPIKELGRVRVSQLLEKLRCHKDVYVENGVIPDLAHYFDLCLFNTFRSYLPVEFFPRFYPLHADDRGQFVELVKTKNGGQTSYSTTKSGITRGNHFHTRKVERFMVVEGEAVMRLRKIGDNRVIEYILSGEKPSFVDVPVWFTHNITNIGTEEMLTVFWINELFNPDDPDAFFEKV